VAIAEEERMLAPYAEQLEVFGLQHALMRRVASEAEPCEEPLA
jgi:cell division protease FtsH